MQINQAEQQALLTPMSNHARVLYLLGLRPLLNLQTGQTQPLNYKTLLTLLNGDGDTFSLGRQVNTLITELMSAGLVCDTHQSTISQSFNGKPLTLPLSVSSQQDYATMHNQWSAMKLDWQPNPNLIADLAKLMGLIEHDYSSTELGEFVAYWLGRPETQFTEFQWNQKFVFNLKKARLAHGLKPVKIVGQQIVTTQPAIEADQNAKNLVAKYGKTGSN